MHQSLSTGASSVGLDPSAEPCVVNALPCRGGSGRACASGGRGLQECVEAVSACVRLLASYPDRLVQLAIAVRRYTETLLDDGRVQNLELHHENGAVSARHPTVAFPQSRSDILHKLLFWHGETHPSMDTAHGDPSSRPRLCAFHAALIPLPAVHFAHMHWIICALCAHNCSNCDAPPYRRRVVVVGGGGGGDPPLHCLWRKWQSICKVMGPLVLKLMH